jgi:UDP-N-acetylmuramate dehydrogenase
MTTAGGPIIHEGKSLKTLSTFGIGGEARYCVEVQSAEQLSMLLRHCEREKIPYFPIGKGSNCLFDDRGLDGMAILNKIDFCHHEAPGRYYVGSGYSFSLLGVQTARHGWRGLEFASGIPATVGGAVYMNAGANGGETADTLIAVDYMHPDGQIERFTREQLSYSYRCSSFQQLSGIILAATFQLQPSVEARQRQLAIVNYRLQTQPQRVKSAGCIFQNPQGSHAGKLIEQCGLKGLTIGGAAVSDVHANFIVNSGGATASDVRDLLCAVQSAVMEQCAVQLQSELRIVGPRGEIVDDKG